MLPLPGFRLCACIFRARFSVRNRYYSDIDLCSIYAYELYIDAGKVIKTTMTWVQHVTPEVEALSQYPTIISVCVSLTVLMALVVAIRSWVRAHLVKRMGFDDYLAICTAVSFATIAEVPQSPKLMLTGDYHRLYRSRDLADQTRPWVASVPSPTSQSLNLLNRVYPRQTFITHEEGVERH